MVALYILISSKEPGSGIGYMLNIFLLNAMGAMFKYRNFDHDFVCSGCW
jgi:hypothetical protein